MENIEPLSKVKIITKNEEFLGILLPKEGNSIVLKLDSGYNIGLLPESIKKIELISPKIEKEIPPNRVNQNKDLKRVMILHTGGTIASRVDYETGGVLASYSPEAMLEIFPELNDVAYIESELIGNMSSDDFRFAHFNRIAQSIYKNTQRGIFRFIVTTGTDFLHYAAAALSFMFTHQPISILVVGSQRSSDRGSSDAAMNLVCAAKFLTQKKWNGVGICMHEHTDDDACIILPGVNSRKMHSSRRDAFKVINGRPLARVAYATDEIRLFQPLLSYNTELHEPKYFDENIKVGMIYSRPNLYAEEFNVYDHFDGLVLVGSGLGHFPINKLDESTKEHANIFGNIEHLAKKMPVVMSVQTLYGRVHMNVYSPGRKLQQIGVLGHGNMMTPETTYIKLAYLLSTCEKKDVPDLLLANICGEMSPSDMSEFK